MSQPLRHSLPAMLILTKQEHTRDCGAAPSLNSDVKPWPGLTPTLNNSQLTKGEGQKECHEFLHGFFQTIKLQAAPSSSWCGCE